MAAAVAGLVEFLASKETLSVSGCLSGNCIQTKMARRQSRRAAIHRITICVTVHSWLRFGSIFLVVVFGLRNKFHSDVITRLPAQFLVRRV